ncbi:MAG: SDR family NAD(P)-dependent oxidoreductase [Pseudomonadota bacterium]
MKTCAIIGVGPGNGEASARRFSADGYAVALLSRTREKLESLAAELPNARAFVCDAEDPVAVQKALEDVAATLGPIDVLVYNAGAGVFGSIEEVDLEAMEAAWRINVLGLAAAAKTVGPDMVARGGGTIFVTGATASLRGGARFAAFTQAKAGQRTLAQSIARHWGPKGIHVAYMIVDGVIDLERTRAMMPDKGDNDFLKPADIAETVHHICHQPRSAWTFEYDLRPFSERW